MTAATASRRSGTGWPAPSRARLKFTPVLEDRHLHHQVTLRRRGNQIAVSCNCLGPEDIEARQAWGNGQAVAAWRAWHQREESTG